MLDNEKYETIHHFGLSIYTKNNEGQESAVSLFWVWCQWKGGGHKTWVNEGVYGRCSLYSYIKIEE
jgi:hypothetical protein